MTLGHGLQFAGALAATLGLLGLAVVVLRRLQLAAPAGLGPRLRVLQRVDLGPRHRVALVQLGARVLVVGMADAGLALLGELDDDERERALKNAPAGPPSAPSAAAGARRCPRRCARGCLRSRSRRRSRSRPGPRTRRRRPRTPAPRTRP